MIVDDDPILRAVYQHRLHRAGFETELTGTGASALARIEGTGAPGIDLVILDLGLPDRDGLDVLADLRARRDANTLPVIVLTGSEGLDERLEALAGGANDYLTKDVELDELIARVKAQVRLLEIWRARLVALSDSRRRVAEELGPLTRADDVETAGAVLTRAVERIAHVEAAALVAERAEHSPDVAPREPARERAGEVHAVPLSTAKETIGSIVVSLAAGLAPDQVRATLMAVADVAIIASPMLGPILHRDTRQRERTAEIMRVIEERAFRTVFQPIVDLQTGGVVGYEALTRFDDGTRPDLAFANAAASGMRAQLEAATALGALTRAAGLPPEHHVSINLSAESALDTDLLRVLVATRRRIVIEITEHEAVEDYPRLVRALETVRGDARIAVDDVGAGYSGLHHLRSLRPDIIKLDRSLVQGLDDDPVGRAMVAGMVHFARETSTFLVGEGIERTSELEALLGLGVCCGQGYLLGRPSAIEDILERETSQERCAPV